MKTTENPLQMERADDWHFKAFDIWEIMTFLALSEMKNEIYM